MFLSALLWAFVPYVFHALFILTGGIFLFLLSVLLFLFACNALLHLGIYAPQRFGLNVNHGRILKDWLLPIVLLFLYLSSDLGTGVLPFPVNN